MTKTVAVIGAGIVGVSTTIWLQRAGQKVILVDRQAPGEGTSHGNAGVLASCSVMPVTGPGLWGKAPKMLLDPNQPLFLRWSYLPRLLPWLLKYMSHANADAARKRAEAMRPIIGDSYNDHVALSSGTGAEQYVHPGDYIFVYRDRAAFEGDAFGWKVRRELGFDYELLEGEALRAYEPELGPDQRLAVRVPGHGRISDPGRYVKALAAHAVAQGAELVTGAVTGVIREGDTVTGLRLGEQTLSCDAAVLTTGVWSGPLAEAFGMTPPPLESERGYHLELLEPSFMPRDPMMIASGKFVATPMDGRLRLAGIVEFGGLEAEPSRAPFRLLEKNIREAFPGLTWTDTVEWMGHRPSISDSLPVIGPSPTLKGAWMGFGHDHVGLTGGPRTGQLLAGLVSGQTPNIDLAPYAPTRFQ